MKRGEIFEQLSDGQINVTIEVASMICGVSSQSYRMWMKQENPPPWNDGEASVPLKELGEWIRAHQVLKSGRGGAGFPYCPNIDKLYKQTATDPKESHEARLKRLQADKMQIELDTVAGKYVPVSEIREAWMTVVVRVKTSMLGLPARIAPLVTGLSDQHEVQGHIQDGIHEALEALADVGDNGL